MQCRHLKYTVDHRIIQKNHSMQTSKEGSNNVIDPAHLAHPSSNTSTSVSLRSSENSTQHLSPKGSRIQSTVSSPQQPSIQPSKKVKQSPLPSIGVRFKWHPYNVNKKEKNKPPQGIEETKDNSQNTLSLNLPGSSFQNPEILDDEWPLWLPVASKQ